MTVITDWRFWAIVSAVLFTGLLLLSIDRMRARARLRSMSSEWHLPERPGQMTGRQPVSRLGGGLVGSMAQMQQSAPEIRVGELAMSDVNSMVEHQAQQALLASERKSRFLAAASHDLRQPIHAITLFGAALAAEPLEGRTRYLVERLLRALSGLDELFNRLLDISRLDTGAIVPRWSVFSVEPLFTTLEARFNGLAADRQIRFRVRARPGLYVRSDATLLIEMIMNLLSNAFRYTERGGVLLAARRRNEELLIQVWDTGRGIPPEHIETIFGEFVQLDNPSRDRRKGLGLGLAIVQRIGQALGHPVTVRSRPGRGSVFVISLPLVDAPQEEPLPATALESVDLNGLLVLAIDDEIDVLIAMEALLSSWGCYVLLARSLPEALDRLASSERFPDVVLTDHVLGNGVTSTQVVESVRAAVPVELRVAIISGEAEPSLETNATTRGWGYMTKPVNPARLREFLATAVSR